MKSLKNRDICLNELFYNIERLPLGDDECDLTKEVFYNVIEEVVKIGFDRYDVIEIMNQEQDRY
jgi:hypothetical protein